MHPDRDTRRTDINNAIIRLVKMIDATVPPGPHRTMALMKVDKASLFLAQAFDAAEAKVA